MSLLSKKEIARPETTPQSWDPFQEMRSMLSWEPFRMMRMPMIDTEFMPAFEVKETKDGYLFKADLPGVKEADLDVRVTGGRLIVAGKRDRERTEENETVYMYERSYGSFQRAFTLPVGIDGDHVRADLKDGVLTILVPRNAEAQFTKVKVNVADKAKA